MFTLRVSQSFWVFSEWICPLCLTPPCYKLKAAIFAAFFLAPNLLITFVLTRPGDLSMIITGNFR